MKSYYPFKSRRKSIAAQALLGLNALHLRLYVTLFKGKPVAVQALFLKTSVSEYKDLALSEIRG